MPCFSKIETKLLDLIFILQAANALGIQVEKRNANSYRLRKDSEYATIERTGEGEKFFVQAYSGSNNLIEAIIKPLTVQYAQDKTKAYFKSKGYTVAQGAKPGEFVFTKYS